MLRQQHLALLVNIQDLPVVAGHILLDRCVTTLANVHVDEIIRHSHECFIAEGDVSTSGCDCVISGLLEHLLGQAGVDAVVGDVPTEWAHVHDNILPILRVRAEHHGVPQQGHGQVHVDILGLEADVLEPKALRLCLLGIVRRRRHLKLNVRSIRSVLNSDVSTAFWIGAELDGEIAAADCTITVIDQLTGVSTRRVVAAADEPSRAAQLQTEPACTATGAAPGAGQFLRIERHGWVAPGGLRLCRRLLRRALNGRQSRIHA